MEMRDKIDKNENKKQPTQTLKKWTKSNFQMMSKETKKHKNYAYMKYDYDNNNNYYYMS